MAIRKGRKCGFADLRGTWRGVVKQSGWFVVPVGRWRSRAKEKAGGVDTVGLFWGEIVRSRLFCEGQISCVRSVLCTPSTARPEGSLQLANDWSQASASAVLHATDGTDGTHAAAVCEGKCSSKIER